MTLFMYSTLFSVTRVISVESKFRYMNIMFSSAATHATKILSPLGESRTPLTSYDN